MDYLIYIHLFGSSFDTKYTYQFIFSDTVENIDGENWDSYPANGHPEPPSKDLISSVWELNGETTLDLAQENEQFSMWDVIDGVLALGWENIDGDNYPNPRLTFRFGDTLDDIKELLKKRDLKINKIKI